LLGEDIMRQQFNALAFFLHFPKRYCPFATAKPIGSWQKAALLAR
jgi:hypothetical protein